MQRHPRGHQVNDGLLHTIEKAFQRNTKEDWAEWMRHFSIELLNESPSSALWTCARLTQLLPFVGHELLAASFVRCWSQLNESSQRQLVQSLEMTFPSPSSSRSSQVELPLSPPTTTIDHMQYRIQLATIASNFPMVLHVKFVNRSSLYKLSKFYRFWV